MGEPLIWASRLWGEDCPVLGAPHLANAHSRSVVGGARQLITLILFAVAGGVGVSSQSWPQLVVRLVLISVIQLC